MNAAVSTEQLKTLAGSELGAGDWFTIDQSRVDAFADITLDHQFIHVDRERAAQTPFGGTIAHGFLTLSLLTHLCEGVTVIPENLVMGINYGFDKVRFLAPVRVGQQVRARVSVVEVSDKGGGQLLLKQRVTVEIQGEEKPALLAEWLALYLCG